MAPSKLFGEALRHLGSLPRRREKIRSRDIYERESSKTALNDDASEEVVGHSIDVRSVDGRSGSYDFDDFPLGKPLSSRLRDLLADRDPFSVAQESRNVAFGGVVGNPAHGLGPPVGESQIQHPRDLDSVVVEHLVKIAEPEQENIVLVFALYGLVLPHQGSVLGGSSPFLDASRDNTVLLPLHKNPLIGQKKSREKFSQLSKTQTEKAAQKRRHREITSGSTPK